MTPCPTAQHLDDLLAERLADDQRRAVEDHVESCPGCQDLLRRRLAAQLASRPTTPGVADADSLPSDLLRRLRDGPPVSGVAGLPSPRPLPRVPGYELLEEVGCGGMGVVYKARP